MVGSIIAFAVLGVQTGYAFYALSFAINIVASSIISKSFSPNINNADLNSVNPGNPQQQPPASDNKLPVVYGTGWAGGIVTDLSITTDNQVMYYVLALSECTGSITSTIISGRSYIVASLGTTTLGEWQTLFSGLSAVPAVNDTITATASGTIANNASVKEDIITFGDVFFGGKKCVFDPTDQYLVTGLLDQSTGLTDTTINGYLSIYFYRNGSFTPANSSTPAITLMQNTSLVYQWTSVKLMTNCAFAIVKITYNQNVGIVGLQPTKFQLTNSRNSPGQCFLDYLTSTTYGAAIPLSGVDTASLTALDVYSSEVMSYTQYGGTIAYQTRFRFDGSLDTNQTIMNNLQIMASCCDCLLRYNEINGLWGVIVQKPTYTLAMDLTDSNIISSIQVTPIDIASSYNIAEVKFIDGTQQDSFITATYNLAVLNAALLYPNEPTNKQSIVLPLVNNSVRAQYLANRFLEGGREDLQIKCKVNYVGLQLEAGDIVTLTNSNYGWTAKLFRINQVIEEFNDDGSITTALSLMEFNPAVYDDKNVTQFTPAPNTGIGNPLNFGTLTAPVVSASSPNAATPSFELEVTSSSAGIVQYAEVWYSAYSNPSSAQRIFIGTTAINADGNPYAPSSSMGTVTISSIPQGNWYFFVQMVNGLGKSNFSAASSVFAWRPTTFQYVKRYLAIAYANNSTGTSGFSYSPRNKAYYGLYNNTTANGGTNPALYTWYAAPSNFSTTNYLLYANRSNRKFSFDVGPASYSLSLGGAFTPTDTANYDISLWFGLIDPSGANQSFIDLDVATGQKIISGTTTGQYQNNGFLSVTNTSTGQLQVGLQRFLNFGDAIYTKSFAASTLTIDVYGRVVGYLEQDQFFYTETVYTATAAQTSFSNTHTVGWILVFRNGLLLDTTEYSETSTTVVMTNACVAGETVIIIYMRGVSTSASYVQTNMTIALSTTNTITYNNNPWQIVNAGDKLTFTDTGTPTQYTVQSINTATKVITFTTTISGATAGLQVFIYRAASANYAPFSRYTASVSAITTYTPTTWAVQNGAESIYVNGCQINEIDYNITGLAIDGFPAPLTGNLTVILYAPNNINVPASNIVNTLTSSIAGATAYTYASNPLSMEVYANGAILAKGSGYDYTATSTSWVLATAFPDSLTLLNQQTFARNGAA
jgi:hypothetical protein